eukprot:451380_1
MDLTKMVGWALFVLLCSGIKAAGRPKPPKKPRDPPSEYEMIHDVVEGVFEDPLGAGFGAATGHMAIGLIHAWQMEQYEKEMTEYHRAMAEYQSRPHQRWDDSDDDELYRYGGHGAQSRSLASRDAGKKKGGKKKSGTGFDMGSGWTDFAA